MHAVKGRAVIFGTIAVTLFLWLGSKWYFDDWFINPYKYGAKSASLIATMLMVWSILLSTRLMIVEDFCGGLDKVYQLHKQLGKWTFYVILLHPLFLAADRLPDLIHFFSFFRLYEFNAGQYLVGHTVGIYTLMLMSGLIAITLWVKIPYHIWKWCHEWFGLVLILTIFHIMLVNADIAAYPALGIWIYGWLALAVIAFVYIRFFYFRFGPRFEYNISSIEVVEDAFEIWLAPTGTPMKFRPSQFVYAIFHNPKISSESHPYSIACGNNTQGRIKLGIKQAGDHTRNLSDLKKGDRVTLYGPYGHFSDKFLLKERESVLIGAGIGITPFLGMWDTVINNPKKYPKTHMFYVSRTEHEASFHNDVCFISIKKQFTDDNCRAHEPHEYELYLTKENGRFTATYIASKVGKIAAKNIFLCGPPPMMNALIAQFKALGVPNSHIITENFILLKS